MAPADMLASHRAGSTTSCSAWSYVREHKRLRAFQCSRRTHRRLQRELRAQYEGDRYITGTPELHIFCCRLLGRLLGSTTRLSTHSKLWFNPFQLLHTANCTGWRRTAVACLHDSLAAAYSRVQQE
jgi:hypothetical protein